MWWLTHFTGKQKIAGCRWRHKSTLGLNQEGHPVWRPLVTAENSTHQKESLNLKRCHVVQLLLKLWKCGTKKIKNAVIHIKMSVISKQLFQYFLSPPQINPIFCICVTSWLFRLKSTVGTLNFSSENMMQSIYLKTQILCCFLFINVNSFYLKKQKQTNRFHTPFSMTMTRSLLSFTVAAGSCLSFLLSSCVGLIELISSTCLLFDQVVSGYIAPLKHPWHPSFAFAGLNASLKKELRESNYFS